MLLRIYRFLLRLPPFKGKSMLTALARRWFFPPRRYTVIHGLHMEIDPHEWTQSDLLRDGCLEPITCTLMSKLLQGGDTYVDVGAQIGFHSLVARSLVGADGRVVAIEPQPYNCEKILRNSRLNGFDNVVLIVAAAGEYDGSVKLHRQCTTDTSRLSLCLQGVNDEAQVFHVPMLRLASLFESLGLRKIKLLKIDVEGYELEVINGLGKYHQYIDNMILEFLAGETTNKSKLSTLIEQLLSSGFKLLTVDGQSWRQSQPLPENNIWACREAL